MSYTDPDTRPYYGLADVKPRTTTSIALGLAAFSYIPGLGILAVTALILAATSTGRREHPLTQDRSHRAVAVAVISIVLQIVVLVGLLVLGVSGSDLKDVTDV
jgi:hypothetical protein